MPSGAQGSGPITSLLAMVLKYRVLLLGATLAAALLAIVPAGELKFDQSIESLYAEDDPHLAAFRASRELFGGDEFVIVAYEDPHLFSKDDDVPELSTESRTRIEQFAEELGQVEGVQAGSTQHLVQALEPTGVLGRVMKRIKGLRRRVLSLVEGVLVAQMVERWRLFCGLLGRRVPMRPRIGHRHLPRSAGWLRHTIRWHRLLESRCRCTTCFVMSSKTGGPCSGGRLACWRL